MPLTRPAPARPTPTRRARTRRYLLCQPRYFAVEYAINPWMQEATEVDPAKALTQWQCLVDTYRGLGHIVETIDPVPGLPDMVFAANGALVVGGRVLGSRFHAEQRQPEAAAYQAWFKAAGFDVREPDAVCEGEGDLVPVGPFLLAGTGFRTTPAAHQQAQEYFGMPTVTLRLTDPYFYHLDTALFALDDDTIAYYPGAFTAGSRDVLRRLFPDAVIATRDDAMAFGLNSVSDGRHVVIAPRATGLIAQLADRGYIPVPVDLSELHKAGGGAKCCTQEVRSA
ncbi:dimethylargininase [Streptomyces jeddahensis]|uniref:Amidinotransferase n=1 Tax=Streptomyces jeddahensis TaxID=1716141 RepID=A0A177HQZ2_9ACTN|nr:dimethylargininase [Streptomyces jeddahensis]OAH12588.1 amidinotransferase [Streptomyces jeddahensis]